MRMSLGRVDFYYAKNGPCDPSVGFFLKEVQDALAEDNIDVMSRRLIHSILRACVLKFKGRVIKARRALLDCPDILGPGSTFERKKKLLSRLQK